MKRKAIYTFWSYQKPVSTFGLNTNHAAMIQETHYVLIGSIDGMWDSNTG